jgi:hypothetical protein
MGFEYSSGVREVANELLYRERQLRLMRRDSANGASRPQIKEFRN